MSNNNEKAQKKQVEEVLEQMIQEWYAEASGGQFPDHVEEDRKTYKGKVIRWLEPKLPGTNILLIEEELGGCWTLRTERFEESVKVFT